MKDGGTSNQYLSHDMHLFHMTKLLQRTQHILLDLYYDAKVQIQKPAEQNELNV
jgi:hypothetical protein